MTDHWEMIAQIIVYLIRVMRDFPETSFLIFLTTFFLLYCLLYFRTASKNDFRKIEFIFANNEHLDAFEAATLRGPYFIFQTALLSLIHKGILIIKGPDQIIEIKETKYNHLHLYEQDLYHHLSKNRGTPSKLFDYNIEDRAGFRIDEVRRKIEKLSEEYSKSDLKLMNIKYYSALLFTIATSVRLYFAGDDLFTSLMTLLISISEILLLFFMAGSIDKNVRRNTYKKVISFSSDKENDLFTVSVFGLKALNHNPDYWTLLESIKQRNHIKARVPGVGRGNYGTMESVFFFNYMKNLMEEKKFYNRLIKFIKRFQFRNRF